MSPLLIYPGFKPHYYGYFLEGLLQVAGPARIAFTTEGFPRFERHCLAFIWKGRRIYLAAQDSPHLNAEGLAWCHLMPKVNLARPPAGRDKLLATGPFFPIRAPSLIRALSVCLRSYSSRFAWSRHFADHLRMLRWNLPESRFAPRAARADYVFIAASLWPREAETNRFRANFIRACRSLPDLHVEGGLIAREDAPEFRDVLTPARVPCREYFSKVQDSLVAFNTPAIEGCLGSKLGEYLALGKAILSTPLHRALPAPLEHGVHVHYVDGCVESIVDAVRLLRREPDYRMSLERAARSYYETYLAPRQVASRILARAEQLPEPAA